MNDCMELHQKLCAQLDQRFDAPNKLTLTHQRHFDLPKFLLNSNFFVVHARMST